jgi:hypothetical protein
MSNITIHQALMGIEAANQFLRPEQKEQLSNIVLTFVAQCLRTNIQEERQEQRRAGMLFPDASNNSVLHLAQQMINARRQTCAEFTEAEIANTAELSFNRNLLNKVIAALNLNSEERTKFRRRVDRKANPEKYREYSRRSYRKKTEQGRQQQVMNEIRDLYNNVNIIV